MQVTIDLSDNEVTYIRQFNQQVKLQPLKKKQLEIPSVQIFLKIAEVIR